MNPNEFAQQASQIKQLIESQISEPENCRLPIYDGAVDVEAYLQSPIRIVWLLKEAYDDVNGTGGGWNYSELLGSESVYKDFFSSHVSRATWHPIIYTSFGILRNFLRWDFMEYLRNNPDMSLIIRKVAIVNTQKLPAKQITKSNMEDIQTAFDKFSSILELQLNSLKPDVIIGGGTLSLYMNLLGLEEDSRVSNGSCDYFISNDKLFIDAYHPAQRTVKRQQYVDDIVSAVEIWSRVRKHPM